jgi:uncharacterized protein (DUF362 family)
MTLNDNRVAFHLLAEKSYPREAPFHPDRPFPEYRGPSSKTPNEVYSGVRETLRLAGLDPDRFGTPGWNPFGGFIRPGMTVFIKPNTVRHRHPDGKDILAVINHASVLRPILDYAVNALEGKGRIIIGDSQIIFGRFEEAYAAAQIDTLLEWYRGQTTVPIECFDLRLVRGTRSWMYGRWGRKKVEQDPRGYRFVDLGRLSAFEGVDPKRLRIAVSSYRNMRKHHSGGRHQYLFPQSVLDSDVIISIPKLKTHRRTAVTLAVKNFMGIPAWKDSLPHFTTGSPSEGGDQYIHPSLRKRIGTVLHDGIQTVPFVPVKFLLATAKWLLWNSRRVVPFKDNVSEAMWPGNDTLWRTLLDLNRGVIYADREGRIQEKPQRAFFAILDGVIGGEKNGPINVDPVPAGVLMAGSNPVAIDIAAATLMGYDVAKIPMIARVLPSSGPPATLEPVLYRGGVDDVQVAVAGETLSLAEFGSRYNLRFEPHPSWKGAVERS